MKSKKELEDDLKIWQSFIANGDLSDKFKDYSQQKIDAIELVLLD